MRLAERRDRVLFFYKTTKSYKYKKRNKSHEHTGMERFLFLFERFDSDRYILIEVDGNPIDKGKWFIDRKTVDKLEEDRWFF
jgi:hypothetical protein